MLRTTRRFFFSPSSSSTVIEPVELHTVCYSRGRPLKNGSLAPAGTFFEHEELKSASKLLIIAHGLLGSARNWTSAARRFSQCLPEDVAMCTVDMRNHGSSPHTEEFRPVANAVDFDALVSKFAQVNPRFDGAVLLGHSFGGSSVASALHHIANSSSSSQQDQQEQSLPALSRYLKATIVADILPDARPLSALGSVEKIFQAMDSVEFNDESNHAGVEKLLHSGISEISMRQFVMTNFTRQPHPRWQCNFHVLRDAVFSGQLFEPPIPKEFHSFQDQPASYKKSQIPTLFLFGAKSPYNCEIGRKRLNHYFEDVEQKEIEGAGHYVHVEKQAEFVKECCDFIKRHV